MGFLFSFSDICAQPPCLGATFCHIYFPHKRWDRKLKLSETFQFHPQTLLEFFLCTSCPRTALQEGVRPLSMFISSAQNLPRCVHRHGDRSEASDKTLQGLQVPLVLHRAEHKVLKLIGTARCNVRRKVFTTDINEVVTYKFFTSMIPRKAFLGIPFIWFSLRSLNKRTEKKIKPFY